MILIKDPFAKINQLKSDNILYKNKVKDNMIENFVNLNEIKFYKWLKLKQAKDLIKEIVRIIIVFIFSINQNLKKKKKNNYSKH